MRNRAKVTPAKCLQIKASFCVLLGCEESSPLQIMGPSSVRMDFKEGFYSQNAMSIACGPKAEGLKKMTSTWKNERKKKRGRKGRGICLLVLTGKWWPGKWA